MAADNAVLQRTASCPTVIQFEQPFRYANLAIPKYAGYVPGKYCETVYGGITHRVNKTCQKRRTLRIDTKKVRGEREPEPPPVEERPWDRRGILEPFAGDHMESRIPARSTSMPHFHATSWLNNQCLSRNVYDGPNRLERNDPFPDRSRRQPRSFWDLAQNKNLRCLMTHGGTVIARMDSDHMLERPIFNPAYNDLINGWSDCAYVGRNVDPAGRLPPNTKQERFGLHKPPRSQMIPGHQIYSPRKYSENYSVGERQCHKKENPNIATRKKRVPGLQT